jgi:hypothetical protein
VIVELVLIDAAYVDDVVDHCWPQLVVLLLAFWFLFMLVKESSDWVSRFEW